jgi:hypothetical protein
VPSSHSTTIASLVLALVSCSVPLGGRCEISDGQYVPGRDHLTAVGTTPRLGQDRLGTFRTGNAPLWQREWQAGGPQLFSAPMEPASTHEIPDAEHVPSRRDCAKEYQERYEFHAAVS